MITLNRFERSQKKVKAEQTLGLKIKPTKCQIFSLVTLLKNDNQQF